MQLRRDLTAWIDRVRGIYGRWPRPQSTLLFIRKWIEERDENEVMLVASNSNIMEMYD